MSETKDLPIYNFYDYMSSIFIYSHVKTFLIDPKRQNYEVTFDYILLILTVIFFFGTFIKFTLIFGYFFVYQAMKAFCTFLRSLYRLKCRKSFGSSCINGCSFLKKILKRTITFNFKLFQNMWIGVVMILSYLIFLVSSFIFYIKNILQAKNPEKTEDYMIIFYIHFESILLVEILCYSFYACSDIRDMNISILSALGIFILLNLILIIGYFIKEKIENVDGIFEHNEPQLIINIIFNVIFSLLTIKCLINIFCFKKNSKYNTYLI